MNKTILAEIIGVGVHTGLRKLTNSNEAIEAWKMIDAMPNKEWEVICDSVAENIVKYLENLPE